MSGQHLSTQPYKGTRDFYPPEMRVRKWMFDQIRRTLAGFGFEEYDTPMLEPFELYAAKTSDEIVNEQLYWLTDRGGRKLAIRPEMTPSLARMVAARQTELAKPIRWFSIPNLWRYERPQRGRLREHWQLNVDILGGASLMLEDVEICHLAVAVLQGFGAVGEKAQFEVRINHREITNALFEQWLRIPQEKHAAVGRLLDGAHKMGPEAFSEALSKEGISSDTIEKLRRLLDPDAGAEIFRVLGDIPGAVHLQELLQKLAAVGIRSQFRFDPSLMRGFMYYTGLVLEVFDLHPDNRRALFGGGRYDNLVGLFGGQKLSGVGFGMGDVTLAHFLETHGLLPNFSQTRGIYVAHLSDSDWAGAMSLAQSLREKVQIPVVTALETQKTKKAFSTAERLGMRFIVFVGSQELASQSFSVKELSTGTVFSGSAGSLAAALRSLLANSNLPA
jgi:histidyl-tRNA synthetase